MVGVVESIGIVAMTAALISALKDGISLFQKGRRQKKKIKAQKAAKKAEESVEEQTLVQAPQAVRSKYDDGVAAFGENFREGDAYAIKEMGATVKKFTSVLFEFVKCFKDDGTPGIEILWSSSLTARDEAITILIQLYQRLAIKVPISRPFNKSKEKAKGKGKAKAVAKGKEPASEDKLLVHHPTPAELFGSPSSLQATFELASCDGLSETSSVLSLSASIGLARSNSTASSFTELSSLSGSLATAARLHRKLSEIHFCDYTATLPLLTSNTAAARLSVAFHQCSHDIGNPQPSSSDNTTESSSVLEANIATLSSGATMGSTSGRASSASSDPWAAPMPTAPRRTSAGRPPVSTNSLYSASVCSMRTLERNIEMLNGTKTEQESYTRVAPSHRSNSSTLNDRIREWYGSVGES